MNSADIAKHLRGLRLRARLTQADLAGICGLSVPSLAKIENGTGTTTLATLLRVTDALGARVEITPGPNEEALPTKGLPRGRRS